MRTNQYMGLLPYMAMFVKVVELGSFSAAAEQLGSSASSVSRQIAELERQLGVRLLERTTRRLCLTEAGTAAWARCNDMVQSAQSVLTLAERVSDSPQGRIKISAPRAFGKKLIAPYVTEFLSRYPQVNLQLMLTDRAMDFISDDIDLMVRITDTPPETMAARPLMQVRHVLCASPDYLRQHGAPQEPQDLAGHDCIWLGEKVSDNQWKLRHRQQNQPPQTITVKGRYAVNHSRARLEGVMEGLGIGCVLAFDAREALASGQVIEVLPEWEYMTSYFGTAWVLYPPNRWLPPKCRALIDFLVEKMAGQPATGTATPDR